MRGESYIYYTGQYWVALFSEEENGKIVRVGQVIFGDEPSSAVFDLWLAQGSPGLIMLDVSHENHSELVKKTNPKRALREVRKQSEALSKKETKSQLAFNKTLEDLKAQSKKAKREKRSELKDELYQLKQEKKKKKKRGR